MTACLSFLTANFSILVLFRVYLKEILLAGPEGLSIKNFKIWNQ
jgi:hypothetical protein